MTRQYRHVDSDGVQHVPDLAHGPRAVPRAGRRRDDEVFVIGGAQIYEAALPLVQTVHLTRVQGTFDGDVAMPAGWLDPFELVGREERDGFAWETYQRRSYYYLGTPAATHQPDDMRRLEAEGRCLFCPGQDHWPSCTGLHSGR